MGAAVDQQTGNLSVFEVIEDLRVPQLPLHLPSLVISLALEKTASESYAGKMLIHLFTPDGKQQVVGNAAVDVPAEQKRMKAMFRFGNFPINTFGDHRIVLSWVNGSGMKDGEAILDFGVIQVTQVAQGMAPPRNPGDKPKLAH